MSAWLGAPPRAFTFDLDGTLARVGWRKLRMWRAVVAHPAELLAWGATLESLRGERWPDVMAEAARRIAAQTKGDPARVAEILHAQIDGRWPELFRGARVPEGVAALLAEVDRRGIPRAVVSDYPALDKLDGLGLGGWVAVVDCRGLGALKPLPDGILAAAAALGLPPGALVHVGDRWETDGLAAARAGARFLHVEHIDSTRPWPFED